MEKPFDNKVYTLKLFSSETAEKVNVASLIIENLNRVNYDECIEHMHSEAVSETKRYLINPEIALKLGYYIISAERLPQSSTHHNFSKDSLNKVDFKRSTKNNTSPSSAQVRQDLAFKLYYLSNSDLTSKQVQENTINLLSEISKVLNSPSNGDVGEKAHNLVSTINYLSQADLPWQLRYPIFGKIHYLLSRTFLGQLLSVIKVKLALQYRQMQKYLALKFKSDQVSNSGYDGN